jgi:HAD superfamily hydrolase (TIGR01459 family)
MSFLPSSPAVLLDGIAAIADRYDGFILDVWGVLHNGVAPYPGVADALSRLKSADKRVVLLSNAPVRAEKVAYRIERIGLPRDLFQGVMSSGEEVWQNLLTRTDPLYAGLGRHCLHLGSPRHRDMLEGLGLIEVEDPHAADFILNLPRPAPNRGRAGRAHALRQCRSSCHAGRRPHRLRRHAGHGL